MSRQDVLALLREQEGAFVSGEEISHRLGLSRAAIWKAVDALRREGYTVEARTGRGYRLLDAPDVLTEPEIRRFLGETARVGRTLVCLAEVDSTNLRARQLAAEGAADGTVVVADRQTAGRGRLGRSFQSPGGQGIYLTALLRPDLPPERLSPVTAMAGVAVCRAVERLCGVSPGLKWPNDPVLDGKKLCGILTELSLEGETARVQELVLGIGINVSQRPEDFTPEVREIAAIAAGGWIAVLVIVIICLIGLLIGSCFGIFFSGEDSGSGYTMQNVVQEINDDYQQQIDTTKANLSHDVLEMSGSRAVWPDVLAVYAVKTTTDPDSPQEVATMDDSKKAILTDIFWEMNQISSRTETRTETVITETDDGNGNIVETETTVTQTYLYITVSHKTAEEMAEQYGFDEEQKEQLAELLAEENRSLWSAVLYGIYTEDGAIVPVALSQVGNVGGEPYWSWYGFSSRVEWCACFVSWCANECGYIDTGVIPKYAGCVNGVQWFKDRGQWMDGSAEPAPGMIIFFDWNDENGQDGLSDHTGIVEKVENGRVYTIEGNSGDSVRQNSYPVGHYEVLGYGCPDF